MYSLRCSEKSNCNVINYFFHKHICNEINCFSK